MAVTLQVELLTDTDRSERVNPGVGRLAAPQQRQAGAAATDFSEQRARAAKGGVRLERVPYRQEQQPPFLRLVDDVELDPGAATDAVQEDVTVAGLADRAGRGRPDLAHAVEIHGLPEAVQGADDRVTGAGSDRPAGREGVAAERHATRQLLDHARRLAGPDFGNRQPDGAGAHVEHGDQAGIGRCGAGGVRSRGNVVNRHQTMIPDG